jgi:hypothetical protein
MPYSLQLTASELAHVKAGLIAHAEKIKDRKKRLEARPQNMDCRHLDAALRAIERLLSRLP